MPQDNGELEQEKSRLESQRTFMLFIMESIPEMADTLDQDYLDATVTRLGIIEELLSQ